MSAAPDEPEPKQLLRVQVQALRERNLDEITDEAMRWCDGCGLEQLFGCAAAVYIGVVYRELCPVCVEALQEGLEVLPRRKL